MTTRILVPSGVLGLGFDTGALEAGLQRNPDIIAIDGGSTDSGPFYLGTATSKYAMPICAAEWRVLMEARARAGVPLVMGSCGTCGADAMVDMFYAMTIALARELRQSVKIARIYCERSRDDLRAAMREGRITALEPAPDFREGDIESLTHIVSLAGAEPIMKAIEGGADIILAGRSTDTAVIAALPLLRGENPGAAWHGAKIAECGAFCSTNPASGVIMLEVDKHGFCVEAMADDALCTPQTVAAHMLYENADPYILHEPGGYLDVREAVYTAASARQVRVEGSRWVAADNNYTVKLEAARIAGYQTTLLAIIRDGRYAENITAWRDKLLAVCREKIARSMGLGDDDYDLELRLIGRDAALGAMEDTAKVAEARPHEIGVLVIITAANQNCANDIGLLVNPYLLHLPLTEQEDMPTFAFPYSPANTERGALYEFALNHVWRLDDPLDGFRMRMDGG